MQVKKHYKFDIKNSLSRIRHYLTDAIDAESVKEVPKEGEITYDNGYYVSCCAVFVDIRDSSSLTYEDTKKNVSKIYRSFVSEVTAIMQCLKQCKHINIVGDCVSGVFDTANPQQDLGEIFVMIARINSIIQILNKELIKNDLPQIKVGIGADFGKTLVIKAGYQGSELDDLVWIGRVVNQAAHLCDMANKQQYPIVLCSKNFYDGLGNATCKKYRGGTALCTDFLINNNGYYGGNFYMVY